MTALLQARPEDRFRGRSGSRTERGTIRHGIARAAAGRRSAQVRDLLEVGGEIVEALGAHEKALGDLRAPGQAKGLGQRRTGGEGCGVMIAVSALGIEPAGLGNRLEEGGLAAAVFTNEKRDPASKGEIDSAGEALDVEGILSSDPSVSGRLATLRRNGAPMACVPARDARAFRLHAQLCHAGARRGRPEGLRARASAPRTALRRGGGAGSASPRCPARWCCRST